MANLRIPLTEIKILLVSYSQETKLLEGKMERMNSVDAGIFKNLIRDRRATERTMTAWLNKCEDERGNL